MLVMFVAAVIGLYGGIAAGLFAVSIRLVQILLFRGGEVAKTLFGPDREMWRRYFVEQLTAARWHLEFAALAGLILLVAVALDRLAGWRLPIFEAKRLRAVALAASLGLALYYPLVLIKTFNGTFHEPEGGLFELLGNAPRFLWLIGPAVGAALAALLVRHVSPESGGHGVVEVIEAVHHRTPIRGRVAIWKSLAAGLVIGSGGSAGREGPVVHLGGAVASSLGRFLELPRRDTSILLAAGAGAGIAASFQAPLAGSLFALEIVLAEFDVRRFAPVVLACVTAVATARALLGGGTELRPVTWTLNHPSEIAVYLVLGVLAGGCGLLYVKAVHEAEERFHRLTLGPVAKAALGGIAVGAIGLVAPRVLGTGIESMNAALAGELTFGALLLALAAKLVATSATLGAGSPGGSFFPAVFLGAMLGGAFGHLAHAALPGIVTGTEAYAAVGMGAVAAGATLAPLTGVLMMFELTGSYQIVLPLLVACGSAALVVHGVLGGSIYTIGASRRGIRLPGRGPRLSDLSVAEALQRIDLAADAATARTAEPLRADDDLGTAVRRLAEAGVSEALVVDAANRPLGIVTREGILEAWRRATGG
jgi:CIC family chloride channel protein